jgi:hypothetical protein
MTDIVHDDHDLMLPELRARARAWRKLAKRGVLNADGLASAYAAHARLSGALRSGKTAPVPSPAPVVAPESPTGALGTGAFAAVVAILATVCGA